MYSRGIPSVDFVRAVGTRHLGTTEGSQSRFSVSKSFLVTALLLCVPSVPRQYLQRC